MPRSYAKLSRLATHTLLAALALALVLSCGRREDWGDPAFVVYRMSLGDPQAFAVFQDLTEDQRRTVIPELVRMYNNSVRREQVLQLLLPLQDNRAKEVYLNALQRDDDREAALGARGLASLEDRQSSAAIAQRLLQATQRESFAPFLEALHVLPSPQAGEAAATLLRRPAARIGGVGNVRAACRLLRLVDEISDDMARGLVFGLVNLQQAPPDDPMNVCEITILHHGEDVIPRLVEMHRGENAEINEHLRSIQFPLVSGKLRAAAVLATLGRPAGADAVTAWFAQEHPVPRTELAAMSIPAQQEWYNTHGEFFQMNVIVLQRTGRPADLETLRRLESTGEGRWLNHFETWFQLSDGSEVGLRQAVHEALMKIGEDADRALLWERARTGTVGRGGVRTNSMLRLNALHYVGRTARPGEVPAYEAALRAQPAAQQLQFQPHRAYFVLADTCADDTACYGRHLRDPNSLLSNDALQAILAGIERDADRDAMERALRNNVRYGAIWQLGTRLKSAPGATDALIEGIGIEDMSMRIELMNALYQHPRLSADQAGRLRAQLEQDEDVRGVPFVTEYRQQLRLLLAARGPRT